MIGINELVDAVPVNDNTYLGDDGLLHCSKCGEAVEEIMDVPLKGIRKVRFICSCIKAEMEADKERERQEEIYRKRKICFGQNSNFYEHRFENDDRTKVKISVAMQSYVQNFTAYKRTGKGLLIHGPVGTGKTYMAACVANALLDDNRRVFMGNLTSMVNTMNSSFDGRQEYINELCRNSLVVIDDLGTERDSSWMREQVYIIINSLYNAKVPMIVTTNVDIEAIKKPADAELQRIYDRVLERCHPVAVDGVSRRRQKIKESFAGIQQNLGLGNGGVQ